MRKSIDDIDFEKSGGLIPIIVQDATTKEILMLIMKKIFLLKMIKNSGLKFSFMVERKAQELMPFHGRKKQKILVLAKFF